MQALDLEALVVTSRDADFRVALVFKGDVKVSPSTTAENPLIVSGLAAPSAVTISITMVPDGMFEGKVCRATGAILAPFRAIRRISILTRHPPPQTADDFLDPADERVWVLIHDAGTADAQYFAVALNGTRAVVCFRDESSAESCRSALDGNGQRQPSVASVMLDEVLYELDDDEDTELCLVDEVVEMFDSAADGPEVIVTDGRGSDAIISAAAAGEGHDGFDATRISRVGERELLDRIFDADASERDSAAEPPPTTVEDLPSRPPEPPPPDRPEER